MAGSFFMFSQVPAMAALIVYPDPAVSANRGKWNNSGLTSISIQTLPTDPVGNTTITFSGVQAGSEIHVYLPDGTEVAGVESCAAGQVLTWPVYASGSANNTVSITIIKRGLRWQKFNYASKLGAQSIPIFPQPDLGYNNPA